MTRLRERHCKAGRSSMSNAFLRSFNDGPANLTGKIVATYV